MKRTGKASSSTEATEFVIVSGEGRNTRAWKAMRNWKNSRYSGWTSDPDAAFIYASWESANRALTRYQKRNRYGFENAQYCTFGEWLRLMNGESLD